MANVRKLTIGGVTYDLQDNVSGYVTTDENLKQTAATASSYSYWRPLVIGNSSSSTEGFTPSTGTAGSYVFNTLEAQPSTGTIRMGKASMYNGSYTSKISPTTLTANRTITIPDKTGTMALTSDISDAISAIPNPMIFKGSLGIGGTITSLPTAAAANEGFVYKVITDGTYASQAAKIGDTFISDGSAWVLIPSGDEPSGTVTSVGLSNATDGGLSVSGGPITSSGTLTVGHSNVLTSAQTTEAVYPIKIDKNGHISSYGSAVTIPDVSGKIDTAGVGLSKSGTTLKANLNSETSLGTIGTTEKLYAVGVDSNGKLCTNVPWTNNTYTLSNSLSSHVFTTTLNESVDRSSTSTTMEFVAGTGITLTDDTTNKKITIASDKEVMVITVSYDERSGEYTADKTYVEIKAAYDAGLSLVLKYPSDYYYDYENAYDVFTAYDFVDYEDPDDGYWGEFTFCKCISTYGSMSNKFVKIYNDNYISVSATYDEQVLSRSMGTAITNYIVGSTSSSSVTGNLYKHASACIDTTADNTTNGYTRLCLGNSTATSSAGGKEGQIRLFGTTANSVVIKAGAPSSSRTITLPDNSGTVALTSDIPTVPTISLNGSSTTSASFYAPTTAGTNGYVLQSNGSSTPTWTSAVLTDTTYSLSNALSSHKFTTTLTEDGTSSSTTATMEFVAGAGITLTDDTTNKKITIASTASTIHIETTAPTSSDGENGDVWFVYTPTT